MVPPMLAVSVSIAETVEALTVICCEAPASDICTVSELRLLGDRRQVRQHLLRESLAVHRQRLNVSAGKALKLKAPRTVGCRPHHRCIGGVVLKRQRGAGNYRARGVGHDALDRGAELRVG